ncbi:hypothetical protein M758_1G023600 [Ceratodon purpureus]|nr:hypothetical protein M758_1G023600 [Ceratodon purpureus]
MMDRFYIALQNAPHPSRNLQVPKDIDPEGSYNVRIVVPDPPAVVVSLARGPPHAVDVEAPAGDPVDALLEGGPSTGLSMSTQEARDSGVILARVLGQRASDNGGRSVYTEFEDYPSDKDDDNDEADEADDDADNLELPVNPEIREEILSQDAEEGERQEVAHKTVVYIPKSSSRTLEQEVVQEAVLVLNPTPNNIMLKQTQADDEHVNTMLQQQVSRAPGDAQYILSSAFEPKSNNTDGLTSAQVISHDVVSILEPITLSQDVQEDKYALKERLMPVKNDSSESSTAHSPSSSSSM